MDRDGSRRGNHLRATCSEIGRWWTQTASSAETQWYNLVCSKSPWQALTPLAYDLAGQPWRQVLPQQAQGAKVPSPYLRSANDEASLKWFFLSLARDSTLLYRYLPVRVPVEFWMVKLPVRARIPMLLFATRVHSIAGILATSSKITCTRYESSRRYLGPEPEIYVCGPIPGDEV